MTTKTLGEELGHNARTTRDSEYIARAEMVLPIMEAAIRQASREGRLSWCTSELGFGPKSSVGDWLVPSELARQWAEEHRLSYSRGIASGSGSLEDVITIDWYDYCRLTWSESAMEMVSKRRDAEREITGEMLACIQRAEHVQLGSIHGIATVAQIAERRPELLEHIVHLLSDDQLRRVLAIAPDHVIPIALERIFALGLDNLAVLRAPKTALKYMSYAQFGMDPEYKMSDKMFDWSLNQEPLAALQYASDRMVERQQMRAVRLVQSAVQLAELKSGTAINR